MAGGDLFTVATAWDETTKRHARAMVARCSKCPRTATVADNAGKARPMTYFAGRFRDKGWRIGGRANAHLCPQCVGGIKPKPALAPAQKRAAFCRLADVPRAATSTAKPKEVTMTAKPDKAPDMRVSTVAIDAGFAKPDLRSIADAPRQPSREDKRKIRDALDAVYLTDKGVYAGAETDASVAKRLDVPRAWVSAEREDAYGPDACEDDGKDALQLQALSAALKKGESEALELAGAFESLRGNVDRVLAKLAKRGVA